MRIKLIPQRSDAALTLSRDGDVLAINGDNFDFSDLPDGAEIPFGEIPSDFIVGPVRRVDGNLQITLVMPCNARSPLLATMPADIIDPPDGVLALPTDEVM
jgi:hypothetical protein